MQLDHDRLAHVVCGRMFLSPSPDTKLHVLKDVLQRTYGTLSGVTIIKLRAGSTLSPAGEGFLIPYRDQYEEVNG